jgi:ribonuclease HI
MVRHKKVRILEKWRPPDEGWTKINVDGVFDSGTGEGGFGIIIWDNTGTVVLTAWLYMGSGRDAEEMEALACNEVLCLAS